MLRQIVVFALVAAASAFSATPALTGLRTKSSACSIQMQADGASRREFLKNTAALGLAAAPIVANADVEYPNVVYLGGGDQIDVNNANIRVYTKLPGMYPSIAGLIVKSGPFKSVDELYNIKGLSPEMKAVIKKYEGNLVALDVAPEYREDVFNNGLYR